MSERAVCLAITHIRDVFLSCRVELWYIKFKKIFKKNSCLWHCEVGSIYIGVVTSATHTRVSHRIFFGGGGGNVMEYNLHVYNYSQNKL